MDVCPYCGIDGRLICGLDCPGSWTNKKNLPKHSPIALRDFQAAALEATRASTAQRKAVYWATGLGKTIFFGHWLAEQKYAGSRAIRKGLVIAHRDELIRQAVDKLRMVKPGLKIGVVKAEQNDVDAPIVVASVQTLQNYKRLKPLLAQGIERVVVDEAHHIEAPTYQRALAMLGCFNDGGPELLGVTATDRPDDTTFEEIVHRMTILDGIRRGFLCDLRAISVRVEADFTLLKKQHGDINEKQAEDLLMQARAPEEIAQAVHEHASGRPTIIFTPGVESSKETARACRRLGVDIYHLDGETPEAERRELLASFRAGEIDGISNCSVLTEGYDEERIGCVVVARPTMSKTLYTQMVGRGTRLFPGKKDCLVLDVVGATHRHDLMGLGGLLVEDFGEDAEAAVDAGSSVTQALEDKARGTLHFEPVDVFARRSFAWVKSELGYVLSLGGKKEGFLLVSQQPDGQWHVWHEVGLPSNGRQLFEGPSLGYAQGIAEDYVRQHPDALILTKKSARWRQGPVSSGQRNMMAVWKVPFVPGMTKGDAADAITAAIVNARARVRRRA